MLLGKSDRNLCNSQLNLQKNFNKRSTNHTRGTMNRQEATAILHEILLDCNGALLASSVYLSQTSPDSFQLGINCSLDDFLRKCINGVVKRHQLKVTEQAGKAVISS